MRGTRERTAIAVLLMLAGAGACRKEAAPVNDVQVLRVATVPADPADPAWRAAPVHIAKLIPQDLVEPRVLTPTTTEVRVRALTDGKTVAFRLEWPDEARDDAPGPSRMVDACAVQIPQANEKEPPAPQMGETGKAVDVTYWRADWQATVDGRGDTIRDLYPNASIDHYPFQAQPLEKGSAAEQEMASRYAPARALGNARSGPRAAPVEDLVAVGPGTLSPVPSRGSSGKGRHDKGVWAVVIGRAWPAVVTPGQRTNVAFAVWQGAAREAGARKMRTGWIPLSAKESR
jgi:hypothetical protein